MIYLGILDRGFLFFSFFRKWLERMGMILVFLCKIETCYIERLVIREEEEDR